ncbi:hypothetical protein ZOSMA_23G00260 [Zostera marina]|uniref:Uncharacterized protein n=1 Tax=Zostera marina TaxID=29655 RepID=A0A0K9PHA9_ZOSMR|nr:hypothetical protein ZOSMA_23G00260 [Zostera marina]
MISAATTLPTVSGSSYRTPHHIKRLGTHIPSSFTIPFSLRCHFPILKSHRNLVLSMSLPLSSSDDPITGNMDQIHRIVF